MLLELRDLKTEITSPAGKAGVVDGVSLHIAAGETLGLVGESGSGKTMLAMSIAGLLPEGGEIAGGDVILGGRSLLHGDPDELRRRRAAEIGVVFQNPMTALNPRLSIGAQLREALPRGQRRDRAAANLRAAELLRVVGVPQPADRLSDFPHELSGGLAQRVVIAMSLARNPKLLIADEPTTALDVSIQAQILDLIDDLKQKYRLAVLLVTHDIGVVADRADRIAVMYAARVVEEGPTRLLLSRPVHPYTRGLLDSLPRLTAGRQRLRPIEGRPPELVNPPAGCRFAPRCADAVERCVLETPPRLALGEDRHFACWRPLHVRAIEAARKEEAGVDEAAGAPIAATEEPILELAALERNFIIQRGPLGIGVRRLRRALSDVSLEVRAGESLGIVGESGCGKSTLARLVAGLDVPTGGSIRYRGRDISQLGGDWRQWRRDVQMIFQDPYSSLDPRMTVREILREPLVYQRDPGRSDDNRLAALLHEVGLSPGFLGRRPAQLSGGQRQRLGIARALALDPKVIIADEAVSALDVSVQATILNLFKELQRSRGLTYLFISHDLGVVRHMCDRVAVMYLGKIVELADTDDIFERPAHPYTRALLDSVPGLAGIGARLEGEMPSAENPPPGCHFHTRCPRVQPLCRTVVPDDTRFGDGRRTKCHFPLVPVTAKPAGARLSLAASNEPTSAA